MTSFRMARGLACALALMAGLGAIAAPASAETIGKCEVAGKKGEFPFTPVKPGTITVEVNLPAPGWFNGDTPETIQDGYEYCMAANIAYRAGLDKVSVVNVPFDGLVAGQTKDFDFALSEISITDARKQVVDFSVPYFSSDIGILAKKGKKVDEAAVKKLRIGIQQGTTGASFVTDTLKPEQAPKVFPDTPSLFTALMANQVDVAMTDTAIVLGQAAESKGKLVVVGQYSTGEVYGALYPKGSANAATIDKIIQSLIDDGTLKKLGSKYLAEAWGADPTKIAYFKP